jgi:hypothetical protein
MKTFALVALADRAARRASRPRGAGDPLDGHQTQRLLRSALAQREHGALGRHRRSDRDRGSRGRRLRENEPCRTEIEKKVEDEFNEIKQRYDLDLDPKSQVLTENQRLQNLKDVFQTIAQGSAALWTPK